ncbi:LysR family transcriptional regulator [soil metagenome]
MRAIADHGSYTAAAESLGYTQPAVSQMVRRLEHRAGTVLVERMGRKVRLTQAGQTLARHAVHVLAALDNAEAEVAAIAGLQAGRVRLMAFPSSSATLVPRALAKVARAHPNVTIKFSEGEPEQSLAAVREGRCDLAVAFSYGGSDVGNGVDRLHGLDVIEILTEPVLLALPAAHGLADRSMIGLADLRYDPWIAGCPHCRGHLLSLCSQADFTPNVAFETEDYVAVLGLVAAGLGVALVPALILHSVTHDGVVTRETSPSSRRSVHIVTTPDLRRVPAVAATIEAVQASARELSTSAYPGLSP